MTLYISVQRLQCTHDIITCSDELDLKDGARRITTLQAYAFITVSEDNLKPKMASRYKYIQFIHKHRTLNVYVN